MLFSIYYYNFLYSCDSFSPTVMSSLIATLGSYNTQNDYDEVCILISTAF